MAELKVEGLIQVVHGVVLARGSHNRRRVSVGALRPRDVVSVMLVVEMAKTADRRWNIANAERLRRMDKAVGMLTVIETALLPALATSPDDSSLLNALSHYNFEASRHATAAGGAFATNAQQVYLTLHHYVLAASEEEDPDLEAVKTLVGSLIDDVKALLDDVVTIALM